ncbi:MAG: hypothetical protein A3E77_18155 [Sphingopyxis sp. RIFCSPHIGHO2_12_FULL_65_19]|nr:MAG: hypothetical protein A3E77_18155 [Sphingopyxis sp. RIFCSPHIGHO2_12_FULL_65_19]
MLVALRGNRWAFAWQDAPRVRWVFCSPNGSITAQTRLPDWDLDISFLFKNYRFASKLGNIVIDAAAKSVMLHSAIRGHKPPR